MEGEGPHAGDPVDLGLLIVGTDPVATDSIASAVMGIDPESVPTLKLGQQKGLGTNDLHTIEVVGEKLQSLAGYHQLLCITHLPQIASKGQTHFLVKKRVKDRRTQTMISELTSEERVKEIARLLGGKRVTAQAMAHAREMLEGYRGTKANRRISNKE